MEKKNLNSIEQYLDKTYQEEEYQEMFEFVPFDQVEEPVLLGSGTVLDKKSLQKINAVNGLYPRTAKPIESISTQDIISIQNDYRRIKQEQEEGRSLLLIILTQLTDLKQTIEEQNRRLDSQTKTMAEQANEIAKLNQSNERLSNENRQFNQQLVNQNTTIEKLTTTINTQQTEIKKLKENNEQLAQQLAENKLYPSLRS